MNDTVHAQLYVPCVPVTHVPPFKHGLLAHPLAAASIITIIITSNHIKKVY